MNRSRGKHPASFALIMLQPTFTRFVDRYIPGYVFFGDGVTEGYEESPGRRKLPPWSGRAMRIVIGKSREVIRCETF